MGNKDVKQDKREQTHIFEEDSRETVPKKRKQRPFGSAKGLIKMADDFDAPLDDFKSYM